MNHSILFLLFISIFSFPVNESLNEIGLKFPESSTGIQKPLTGIALSKNQQISDNSTFKLTFLHYNNPLNSQVYIEIYNTSNNTRILEDHTTNGFIEINRSILNASTTYRFVCWSNEYKTIELSFQGFPRLLEIKLHFKLQTDETYLESVSGKVFKWNRGNPDPWEQYPLQLLLPPNITLSQTTGDSWLTVKGSYKFDNFNSNSERADRATIVFEGINRIELIKASDDVELDVVLDDSRDFRVDQSQGK